MFGLEAGSRLWRVLQIATVLGLCALLGCILQLVKLGSLDAAGRLYGVTSNGSKTSFLATFGVCKAFANLALGFLVQGPLGLKWSGAVGWGVCLLVPILAGGLFHSWPATVAANAFLGINQGMVRTALVLAIVPLFAESQSGLALGLLELVVYGALAASAQLYGALEDRQVHCAWRNNIPPLAVGGTQAEAVCAAASAGQCVAPDSWVPQCAGQCVCNGYEMLLGAGAGVIAVLGLLFHVGFLAEPVKKVAGDDEGETVGKGEFIGGDSGRALVAVDGHNLGRSIGRSGGKRRKWKGQTACGEGLVRCSSVLVSGMREGARGYESDNSEEDEEWGSQGDNLEAVRMLGRGRVSGGAMSDREYQYATLREKMEATARGMVSFSLGQGPAGLSSFILCISGHICNVIMSMAWGLLLAWARDGLGVPSDARNLMAATYQWFMAVVLLVASMLSDVVGRKWMIAGGLVTSAAGLVTAALGAGFGAGAGVGGTGAGMLLFGYLELASVLLGCGTGLMYGCMAAGVVDHSTASDQAVNMSTFRFWRDLGYAVGVVSSMAADATSPEVAMLVFAALAVAVAALVMGGYREKLAGSSPDDCGATVTIAAKEMRGHRAVEMGVATKEGAGVSGVGGEAAGSQGPAGPGVAEMADKAVGAVMGGGETSCTRLSGTPPAGANGVGGGH